MSFSQSSMNFKNEKEIQDTNIVCLPTLYLQKLCDVAIDLLNIDSSE